MMEKLKNNNIVLMTLLILMHTQFQVSAENGELKSNEHLESSLEERIEELRHRLRIEAAVVDGAKNVIRTLQSTKTIDKKALQEVSATFTISLVLWFKILFISIGKFSVNS